MIAVAATVAAQIDARVLRQLDDRRVLSATLLLGATGALVFHALFATHGEWVPQAFYVWTGAMATVAVAQLWRLLTEVFTVSSAKRLFPRIGAGGALGAISGAAAAELAQQWLDPRGLLLIGAVVFAASAIVPWWLLPAPEPRAARASTAGDRGAEIARGARRHVRGLLLIVMLTAATATLVDYAFKATIDQEIAPAALGTFFSRFHLGLNLVSLLGQLALAPLLLRTLGVTRALLVMPVTLAAGALGGLLLGGLGAAIALRGAEGGLRQSLHRSTIELLYFPLSTRQRRRYKGSIEALGQRSGQALGSIAIALAMVAGYGLREISIAVIALAGIWAVLALSLRRGYLELFRENLRTGVIATSPGATVLDLHSLESLIASLNSERDEEVLATLEILLESDRARLVPALLLYHPSRAVVLRTLEILGESGRTDFVAIARRLLDHRDDEIRAATMSLLARTLEDAALHDSLSRETSDAARAAILVELAARGTDDDGARARRALGAAAHGGTEQERIALARAIRLRGDPAFRLELHELASRAEGELRREVARAFGALRDETGVGTLIHWLAPRGARVEVRAALVAIGPPALAALETALADVALPRELRAHLPRTVARFGDAAAAGVLFAQLEREPDGWIRHKILRALRSLRDALPDHRFDSARLARATRVALLRACDVLGRRIAVRSARAREPAVRTATGEMLEPILAEKEAQAIDRAVRMIALAHPREMVNGIVHAVQSADRRLRAESRELLANVADPVIGAALSALLDDDAEDGERLARALSALGLPAAEHATYLTVVRELIADESEAIRCIAAYHAAELGRDELAGSLAEAERRAEGLSRDVVTHALETLERITVVKSA